MARRTWACLRMTANQLALLRQCSFLNEVLSREGRHLQMGVRVGVRVRVGEWMGGTHLVSPSISLGSAMGQAL